MIHREGKATIFLSLLVLGALNGLVFYFLPELTWLQNILLGISVILLVIVLQFFRNPSITPTLGDNLVISPADGKVVVIEEVEEPEFFNGQKRLQVSVFMSPFNVHVNRNPVAGIVKYFRYHPGKYLVAWHPKSSTENERTTTVIERKDGVQVLFRQIAGALAKRIVWYLKEGQPVSQAGEMGFIKFGSRVDIFLPLDAKIKVELNQVVKGGRTVLAEV
ncbi:MAG: phosphatidylserine decarboxylase family protein [Bacteroidetes bacterium]|nr:phosphatidylserine decarboxylase family protein [Bacteroidota bacterium]MCK6610581.1 phosphatidylserine decarboxylase family protein [Bacteroidia bacterium]